MICLFLISGNLPAVRHGMGDGRWEMGDGRWEMEDGSWEMGDGSLIIEI
jgi:hypothetical protein